MAADAHRPRGRAFSLARVLDFDAPHPRAFGAPPATTDALTVGAFTGDVARGGSCNCRRVSLVPHCNGTHTESAAHLTREPLPLLDIVPLGTLPAVLIDVSPVRGPDGDRRITAESLANASPAASGAELLVLRTGASALDDPNPPYIATAAMQWIVERGFRHLVVDLPSVDRADDGGELAAHRIFFGLPPGSTRLADATRADATITELAHVPAECPAGPCDVQLQLTAWTGDAVPSRPVLFIRLEP